MTGQSHSRTLTFSSAKHADTVGDLGYAEELGNYAEYSGAPNTQVAKVSCRLSCQMSNTFVPSADVLGR